MPTLLELPTELLIMVGEDSPIVYKLLRATCKRANELLIDTFRKHYFREIDIDMASQGRGKPRGPYELYERKIGISMKKLHELLKWGIGPYVKSICLKARDFLYEAKGETDGPNNLIGAGEDIVLRWNSIAWDSVLDGTLAKMYAECVSRLPSLEEVHFLPFEADDYMKEEVLQTVPTKWLLVLSCVLPTTLQFVPSIRVIDVQSNLDTPSIDMPSYRSDTVPKGAPLSLFNTLFSSGISLDSLGKLRLGLSLDNEPAVDDYAELLYRGCKRLNSLSSLDLIFDDSANAFKFFDTLSKSMKLTRIKHFGLALLAPQFQSLSRILATGKVLESLSLRLITLILPDWEDALRKVAEIETIVDLRLECINIEWYGLDFTKINKTLPVWLEGKDAKEEDVPGWVYVTGKLAIDASRALIVDRYDDIPQLLAELLQLRDFSTQWGPWPGSFYN